MKIMSLNLRVDTERDGVNYFFHRSPRVLKTIQDENPDVIGFQEGTEKIRTFLYENLLGYTILGCGRNVNYQGEGLPIAFKTGKFDLISFESECLSPTPKIIGTTYGGDQSRFPRMYHRAVLRRREDGKIFSFYNIHTDHVGKQAQISECRQLLQKMKFEQDENIVVTGDFNAYPNSETIKVMLSDTAVPLVDLTENIPVTFTCYDTYNEGVKIDYIFSNMKKISSYAVENKPIDGVYISDHNPVVAEIEY